LRGSTSLALPGCYSDAEKVSETDGVKKPNLAGSRVSRHSTTQVKSESFRSDAQTGQTGDSYLLVRGVKFKLQTSKYAGLRIEIRSERLKVKQQQYAACVSSFQAGT
jgi:hypothetical protein